MPTNNITTSLSLLFFSFFLTSCMMGPDFKTPAPPAVKTYTHAPIPSKTTAIAAKGSVMQTQYFLNGKDIPSEWWKLFHSPQLNQFITQGLANSPNLIAAKAALAQAQETWKAQIGSSLLPALNGVVGGERQLEPGANIDFEDSPGLIYNLYNVAFAVSYTPDVFGGARRQIESLRAKVDYQRYELMAAYLTLTSNIVTTAITIASLEEQIKATHALVAEEQKQLEIIKKQFKLGGASGESVLTQERL